MALEDIKEVADELGKKFEQFKNTNEKRLEAVEQEKGALAGKVEKLSADLVEMAEIKRRLETIETRGARPGVTGGQKSEHRKAFVDYLRKGKDDGLSELQAKALSVGSDPDGGYAVPGELETEVASLLRNDVPMRRLARVITVSTEDYRKLVNVHGAASGWVGETDDRPATNTPQLAQLIPFMGELYANPQATQKVLDDSMFDMEAWLQEELALEFAEKENAAFVNGNGTNKPKGFLAYATAATSDAARAFGTLQHIEGAASGLVGADELRRFATHLRPGYLPNSKWQFNRNTLGTLMVLKDGDGNYIWNPGLGTSQMMTLAGYGYEVNDDMPDIAAGSLPIAFGDWQRAYYIVDRVGTRVLRDPFTNKPNVGFYTTKRVGGMLVDSQAIKLFKVKV